jgi:peptide/nickel transport system ATP-binding protein/oligopeptide transport system ATP-binding protein
VIAEVCDEVYIMYAGKIMEKADVFTLFDHPAHPYTRGLLQSIPGMREQEKQKRLYNIKGMVPNLLHIPRGCRFHPRCEKVMAICCEREPNFFDLSDGHQVRCWLYQKKGEAE